MNNGRINAKKLFNSDKTILHFLVKSNVNLTVHRIGQAYKQHNAEFIIESLNKNITTDETIGDPQ